MVTYNGHKPLFNGPAALSSINTGRHAQALLTRECKALFAREAEEPAGTSDVAASFLKALDKIRALDAFTKNEIIDGTAEGGNESTPTANFGNVMTSGNDECPLISPTANNVSPGLAIATTGIATFATFFQVTAHSANGKLTCLRAPQKWTSKRHSQTSARKYSTSQTQ
ncbi:hypothetical protein ERJ75_001700900 [Trypanosoma vivax]|nr:hypothetical protein ERJ75_001700900 [Trypanosoma vivax]